MKRSLLGRLVARLRDASGANLIEAAIITPLMLLLTFSIIDFGALFFVYLSLENGVSVATRYGVTGNQADDPNNPGTQLSREDSIKLAMRQATPTLTLADSAFSFSHLTPGSGTWLSGAGAPSDIEKVTVDYDWYILTPFMKPFFSGGYFHFKVDSAMKNEGRFQ